MKLWLIHDTSVLVVSQNKGLCDLCQMLYWIHLSFQTLFVCSMYRRKADQQKKLGANRATSFRIDIYWNLWFIPFGFLEWSTIFYIIHRRMFLFWEPTSNPLKVWGFRQVQNIQGWCWDERSWGSLFCIWNRKK